MAPRKTIREFSHFAFGNPQYFGNFGEGATRLKGREATDDRAMFLPELLKDDFHHVIFAVMRKINVNVRQLVQGHPVLVQKPAKIKVEPDRADAADAKAIADEAGRWTHRCRFVVFGRLAFIGTWPRRMAAAGH